MNDDEVEPDQDSARPQTLLRQRQCAQNRRSKPETGELDLFRIANSYHASM